MLKCSPLQARHGRREEEVTGPRSEAASYSYLQCVVFTDALLFLYSHFVQENNTYSLKTNQCSLSARLQNISEHYCNTANKHHPPWCQATASALMFGVSENKDFFLFKMQKRRQNHQKNSGACTFTGVSTVKVAQSAKCDDCLIHGTNRQTTTVVWCHHTILPVNHCYMSMLEMLIKLRSQHYQKRSIN